ncbi:MAG TPA: hypothetical protein VMF50_06775 [Candidatus Binataceae bacterium]|nr:hypothetical protein [Candidatus Binataceae bacterium]
MDTTVVRFGFPDCDGPEGNQLAESLLSEIKQDAELKQYLDRDQTTVQRNDREAQDFGVSLIAVLGTPAVIILAKAVKSWVERTGTILEINGARIKNVRSQDYAEIVRAIENKAGSPRK